MAAGSSAPELATAVIAVFIAQVYHATTCTYLKRISFNCKSELAFPIYREIVMHINPIFLQ